MTRYVFIIIDFKLDYFNYSCNNAPVNVAREEDRESLDPLTSLYSDMINRLHLMEYQVPGVIVCMI